MPVQWYDGVTRVKGSRSSFVTMLYPLRGTELLWVLKPLNKPASELQGGAGNKTFMSISLDVTMAEVTFLVAVMRP